jgi:hypothetical protein
MRILTTLLLFAATSASAQAADPAPTCAEQGHQRVAVMIPPGKSVDETREIVSTSFPAGTQIRILAPGDLMPMTNGEKFDVWMTDALYSLLNTGLKIEGSMTTLLVLDESGAVVEAHPSTGTHQVERRLKHQVDRTLQRTWMLARFEPYEVGGCRVRAYVHVPLSFRSDFSLQERRLDVRPVEPR